MVTDLSGMVLRHHRSALALWLPGCHPSPCLPADRPGAFHPSLRTHGLARLERGGHGRPPITRHTTLSCHTHVREGSERGVPASAALRDRDPRPWPRAHRALPSPGQSVGGADYWWRVQCRRWDTFNRINLMLRSFSLNFVSVTFRSPCQLIII